MPAAATDAHARQRRAVNGCARPCQRVLAAGLSPPPRTHSRLWKRHGRRAVIEIRGVARTRRGTRRSCARCLRLLAERRRVRHSHALRLIWLASFVAAFSPIVARSPDCWRGGAPSTSGVTEPPGSGREHAPIAAVGRRKKLDCRMGLTEKSHFTVDVLQSSDSIYTAIPNCMPTTSPAPCRRLAGWESRLARARPASHRRCLSVHARGLDAPADASS